MSSVSASLTFSHAMDMAVGALVKTSFWVAGAIVYVGTKIERYILGGIEETVEEGWTILQD